MQMPRQWLPCQSGSPHCQLDTPHCLRCDGQIMKHCADFINISCELMHQADINAAINAVIFGDVRRECGDLEYGTFRRTLGARYRQGWNRGWKCPNMIADVDIWRAAWMLVDRHGENATAEASERAVKLIKVGDVDGAAAWRQILAAVYELQRARPGNDEAVN